MGVTASGLVAAGQILGCGLTDLLTERGPSLTIYPSERPEEWLDSLRTRRNRAAEQPRRLAA